MWIISFKYTTNINHQHKFIHLVNWLKKVNEKIKQNKNKVFKSEQKKRKIKLLWQKQQQQQYKDKTNNNNNNKTNKKK